MSAALVDRLSLGRRVANLAAEYATSCPAEAARLLVHAAWIFRVNGADAAADVCARSAEALRAATRLPRSRPFCPPAVAPQEMLERHRVGDWDLLPSEADAAELKRLGAGRLLAPSGRRP